jgi:D-alanyl-D-alanine dipeptidase
MKALHGRYVTEVHCSHIFDMATFDSSLAALRAIASSGDVSNKARILEAECALAYVLAARHSIRIEENGEPLTSIPRDAFSFAEPHLYVEAGAPYGETSPYFLRESVVDRLIHAQQALQKERPGYSLHIFDGFRPQVVQVYMRQYDHDRFAREEGLDPKNLSSEQDEAMWEKVNLLWAQPSTNPLSPPPPHSTGAAVDLTILDPSGAPLAMGSEFDEASERILPNYYSKQKDCAAVEICTNRELLNRIMSRAGFHRLTHEWWHFSRGDQMWALLESITTGQDVCALYGEVNVPK